MIRHEFVKDRAMQPSVNLELDNMFDGNELFKSPSNAAHFGEDTRLEQRQAGTVAANTAPIFNRPMVTQPRPELELEEVTIDAPAPVSKAAPTSKPAPVAPPAPAGHATLQPAAPTKFIEPQAPSPLESGPPKPTIGEEDVAPEPVKPKASAVKPKKVKKPSAPMNRTKLVRGVTLGALLMGGAYLTMNADIGKDFSTAAITRQIQQMVMPDLTPVQQAAPMRRAVPVETKDEVSVTQLTDSTPAAMPVAAREEQAPVAEAAQPVPVAAPVMAQVTATAPAAPVAPELKAPLAQPTQSTPTVKIAPASTPAPATAPTAAHVSLPAVPPAPAIVTAPVAPAPKAAPIALQNLPAPATPTIKPVSAPAKPAPAPVQAKPAVATVSSAPASVASTAGLPAPKANMPLPAVVATQAKPVNSSGRMTIVREGKPGQVANDDEIIYPISNK
jgi:hypothetical protein